MLYIGWILLVSRGNRVTGLAFREIMIYKLNRLHPVILSTLLL